MKKSINLCYLLVVVLGLMALLGACDQTQEPFESRKTRDNSADIKSYLTAKKLTADSLSSGLYYIVKTSASNTQLPQTGDEITMKFISRRLDDVLVDSTDKDFPYTYIRIPYSSTNAYRFAYLPSIEDLMQLEKIKEGDKLTLFVPWSLRGASTASLLAPLYIPLRYDIVVLKIRTESEQIDDYFTTNKITPTEKASNGIRFVKTLVNRDSTAIKIGDEVSVTYAGKWASNGKLFDAGTLNVTVVDTAAAAATGSVVKGFNAGIFRMKYGEKATIAFPSTLGYGATGSGSKIPAYSPLVFDIEVKRKP